MTPSLLSPAQQQIVQKMQGGAVLRDSYFAWLSGNGADECEALSDEDFDALRDMKLIAVKGESLIVREWELTDLGRSLAATEIEQCRQLRLS